MKRVKFVTIASLSFKQMCWLKPGETDFDTTLWLINWAPFFPNPREVVLQRRHNFFNRQMDIMKPPQSSGICVRLFRAARYSLREKLKDEVRKEMKKLESRWRDVSRFLVREKAAEGIEWEAPKLNLARVLDFGGPSVRAPNGPCQNQNCTCNFAHTEWPSLSIATKEKASEGGVEKAFTYAQVLVGT
jgi:hypothetical protein